MQNDSDNTDPMTYEAHQQELAANRKRRELLLEGAKYQATWSAQQDPTKSTTPVKPKRRQPAVPKS